MFSWQYWQYLLNLAEGLQRFVRHNNFLKEGFKSGSLAALVQISSTIKKELRNLRFRQHPCVFFFANQGMCEASQRTCSEENLLWIGLGGCRQRKPSLHRMCRVVQWFAAVWCTRWSVWVTQSVCVCVWDFVCAMIMLKSNTNITRRGKHKCMLEQQHINPCGSVCADTIADKRTFVQWNQMISTGMDLSGKWNHTSTHWVTR